MVVVVVESKFSDCLWQSFSLALAKPYNDSGVNIGQDAGGKANLERNLIRGLVKFQ